MSLLPYDQSLSSLVSVLNNRAEQSAPPDTTAAPAFAPMLPGGPPSQEYKRFLKYLTAANVISGAADAPSTAFEQRTTNVTLSHRVIPALPTEINRFRVLRTFHADSCRLATSPVLCLPALESLSLRSNLLPSLSFLGVLPSLRRLDLSGCPIDVLAITMPLPSIEELCLSGCRPSPDAALVVDAASLTVVAPTLRVLDISGTGITSLAPFAALYGLRKLTCTNLPLGAVRDLQPLSAMPALEDLDFRGSPLARDTRAVETAVYLCPALATVNGRRYVPQQRAGFRSRVLRAGRTTESWLPRAASASTAVPAPAPAPARARGGLAWNETGETPAAPRRQSLPRVQTDDRAARRAARAVAQVRQSGLTPVSHGAL